MAASPTVVFAEVTTPLLDKATDPIKEYLWKQGMSTAPTGMYLAARYQLLTEICGKPDMDEEVQMHLRMAAVEAPPAMIATWHALFKKKMREVLLANPSEAREFCK
jgi:hypothetical protein